jgi:hypothetical protein
MNRDELRSIRDILLLVGVKVPLVVMNDWSGWELDAAADWASATHFRASDNLIKIPPMPACMKAYLPEVAR